MSNYNLLSPLIPNGNPTSVTNLINPVPQHDADHNYLLKNKESFRKGKWTKEEETYANKVIEYFNAGTIKLDDQYRGITLRAYLSYKLGCDPMRITKKYTGASCLGKRVYHAYRQAGQIEEIERATAELDALEKDFRFKLNQISQKRGTSEFKGSKQSSMVTTPAIDALFYHPPYHAVDQHQQWMNASPPHQHIPSTNPFTYGMPTHTPSYTNAASSTSSSTTATGQMHGSNRQDWKPPHQSQAGTQIPAPSSHEWFTTRPVEEMNLHSPTSTGGRAISSSSATISAPGHYITDPNHTADNNQSMLSKSIHSSISFIDGEQGHSEEKQGDKRPRIEAGYSILPALPPHPVPPVPDPAAAVEAVETVPLGIVPSSNAYTVDASLPIDASPRIIPTAPHEHDNEAASSLLGFFTHLERNSSQEDMLNFFEGVQKNVSALSPSVPSTSRPPLGSSGGTLSRSGSCSRLSSHSVGPSGTTGTLNRGGSSGRLTGLLTSSNALTGGTLSRGGSSSRLNSLAGLPGPGGYGGGGILGNSSSLPITSGTPRSTGPMRGRTSENARQ